MVSQKPEGKRISEPPNTMLSESEILESARKQPSVEPLRKKQCSSKMSIADEIQ